VNPLQCPFCFCEKPTPRSVGYHVIDHLPWDRFNDAYQEIWDVLVASVVQLVGGAGSLAELERLEDLRRQTWSKWRPAASEPLYLRKNGRSALLPRQASKNAS
jgi:hypothetical protein